VQAKKTSTKTETTCRNPIPGWASLFSGFHQADFTCAQAAIT
jgi:hypothetical protein